MIQIALIVIGLAFAITGIVLFIKGVGSSDISSFRAPGTEFRVPSNGLFIVAVGVVLILAGALIPTPQPQPSNGYVTPTLTPIATPPSTPAPTSTPVVSIEPPSQDNGYVIASRKAGTSDTAWYFKLSGKVSDIDPTKHSTPWLSLLFHEAESSQGVWWVQSSKPIGDRNDWSAEGFADDRFFTDPRRPEHKVEVRAVITNTELPKSAHIPVLGDGKFEKICLSGTDHPCVVPLSEFKFVVMSKIIVFKLKKSA